MFGAQWATWRIRDDTVLKVTGHVALWSKEGEVYIISFVWLAANAIVSKEESHISGMYCHCVGWLVPLHDIRCAISQCRLIGPPPLIFSGIYCHRVGWFIPLHVVHKAVFSHGFCVSSVYLLTTCTLAGAGVCHQSHQVMTVKLVL